MCCLSYTAKASYRFDIEARHHVRRAVIDSHHRVCLRFGVVIAVQSARAQKIDRQIGNQQPQLLAGRRGRDGGDL